MACLAGLVKPLSMHLSPALSLLPVRVPPEGERAFELRIAPACQGSTARDCRFIPYCPY